MTLPGLGFEIAIAALLCAGLIVIIRPALRRYALARPNVRSSHQQSTPQGGGIAVVLVTLIVVELTAARSGMLPPPTALFAATIVMAIVGIVDDIRTLGVVPRLILQSASVAAVISVLPEDFHLIALSPWGLDRALLFIGGLWFVNLVNFMDGIDLMTVAEIVPISAALIIIGHLGVLPAAGTSVAAALCGALIGFSYFNRPPAQLFLGDVGSLPIGLLLGWLLALLASRGALVAAILLPLYYLADATLTLCRRLLAGERVWHAHRTHFYQRATDLGFTVGDVIVRVFAVNLGLAAIAIASVIMPRADVDIAALGVGVAMVGWLLWSLAHGRR